jgi:diguanylate cyclase (GGDEF)-like protein
MMDGRRRTVGLIVDQISSLVDQDFFQNIIISGVADVMRERDMNLVVLIVGKLHSPHGWENSRNILMEYVKNGLVDGLIVLSTSIAGYVDKQSIGRMLQDIRVPVVSIGETYDSHPSVISGCYGAMRTMIDHLIEVHGKRKLAFIKGPEGGHESEIRFAAYLDSLAAHGIPFEVDRTFTGNYLYASGQAAVRHFHERGVVYDALIASNDNMALGAISELKRLYRVVPPDLSIVGFDDAVFAGPLGLTTVRQNFRLQAKTAAEILCRMMDGENIDVRLELGSELVVRSSCGCVPNVVINAFRRPEDEPDRTHRAAGPDGLKKALLGVIRDGEPVGRNGAGKAPGEEEFVCFLYERLAAALAESVFNGHGLAFYQALDQYLNYLRDTDKPLDGLQDWLSGLRANTLRLLPSPDLAPFTEDLFHAARVHISEWQIKQSSTRYFLSSLQTAQLDQFSEELFSALHYREQMKRTEELLAKYGIRYAFVALYEDPDKPLDMARLILEVRDGQWIEHGEGVVFPTLELLPESVRRQLSDRRLDLVVQVLYHGDTRLGYTVFSFDDRVTRYYDVINSRLSIALKNAKHIMEEKTYSQKLEQQVAERTKELTRTNAQLREEIIKRQEAEDKLRKALEDLAALNAELRAISIRDELTGLLNRRGFMEQSRDAIRRFAMNGQGCILMFADLDNLKGINDRYGHGEGDIAIIRAAGLLRDALPEDSVLARLGGDEFTAVIPVPPNCRDECVRIRERIETAFASYNRTSASQYNLSISLGFACREPDGTATFEEMMIRADNRLYEQKKARRAM